MTFLCTFIMTLLIFSLRAALFLLFLLTQSLSPRCESLSASHLGCFQAWKFCMMALNAPYISLVVFCFLVLSVCLALVDLMHVSRPEMAR